MKLQKLHPDVVAALERDGAVRYVDGRWSGGFVDPSYLDDGLESGLLRACRRDDFTFVESAVLNVYGFCWSAGSGESGVVVVAARGEKAARSVYDEALQGLAARSHGDLTLEHARLLDGVTALGDQRVLADW